MAAEVSVSAVNYFIPIFAFLLVFIVVYALLVKSQVLGGSQAVMLFVSFILASFFITEASLVDFVQINSAWFGVLVIFVFFLMALLAFIPGKEPLAFLGTGNWLSWVLIAGLVALFIFSSAYVFQWTINWGTVGSETSKDWFGMVLLLAVGGIVSWIITKTK